MTRGDIVLVQVPFVGASGAKLRSLLSGSFPDGHVRASTNSFRIERENDIMIAAPNAMTSGYNQGQS